MGNPCHALAVLTAVLIWESTRRTAWGVRVSPQTCLLFKLLRRELDGLLLRKAREPDSWPEHGPAGRAVVETVRAVMRQLDAKAG